MVHCKNVKRVNYEIQTPHEFSLSNYHILLFYAPNHLYNSVFKVKTKTRYLTSHWGILSNKNFGNHVSK